MGFIYKVTNLFNQKVYIGQTSRTVEDRWKEHLYDSNNPSRDNYCNYFHNAIRKYGASSFIVETIEECENEILNDREIYWIDFYGSQDNYIGYNSTSGGDNSFSRRSESEATRARKSAAQLGEKNSFYGKKHTNEHRSRISTPVVAYTDDGSIYACYISQISATNDGFQQRHITRCVHDKTKHHGKTETGERLRWRFASQGEANLIVSHFLNSGAYKLNSCEFTKYKEVA